MMNAADNDGGLKVIVASSCAVWFLRAFDACSVADKEKIRKLCKPISVRTEVSFEDQQKLYDFIESKQPSD